MLRHNRQCCLLQIHGLTLANLSLCGRRREGPGFVCDLTDLRCKIAQVKVHCKQ